MYAIVLGLKPKTIHLKNIKSEKTSYLNAPDKNVKKGDVLEVNIKSKNFSKGMTFFKGEYKKLNDGESEFDHCLKCEKESNKGKPLCYECWKDLTKKESSKSGKRKDLEDLNGGELIKLNKEIQYIARNFAFEEKIEDLSFGKVKKAFNDLKEEKKKSFEVSLKDIKSIDEKFYHYNEIKGLMFEVSFHQIMEKMKSNEYGIKEINPNYTDHWLTGDDYSYEADGEIKFKLGKRNVEDPVYALYDCKAYYNGYNIKTHLEKMINYIHQKQDDRRIKKHYKYFIVVSGKFKGNPEYHTKKVSEKGLEDFRFILLKSSQIKKLYDEQFGRIWRSKLFYDEFKWEKILEPQNAKPIEVIQDEKIDELIKDARKRAD